MALARAEKTQVSKARPGPPTQRSSGSFIFLGGLQAHEHFGRKLFGTSTSV
jgi:hypothetical protein